MSEQVKNYPPYLDYPKPRKKQTNADRIRAMTDEELAQVLHCQRTQSPYVVGNDSCETTDCIDCTLAWLKKEASE